MYLEFHDAVDDPTALQNAVDHVHRHPFLHPAHDLAPAQIRQIRSTPPQLAVHAPSIDDVETLRKSVRHRIATSHGDTWRVEPTRLPHGGTVVHLMISLTATDPAGIGVMVDEHPVAMRDGVPRDGAIAVRGRYFHHVTRIDRTPEIVLRELRLAVAAGAAS